MGDRKREERISYIISKLESSNSEKAYSGLVEIRTSVIKSSSGISTLLRLGGIGPLVDQLKKSSSKLIDITLSILGNLSLEPELRKLVSDSPLLDQLIQIVKSIRNESILCRAYRTIGNLAEDPTLSSNLNDLRAPEMIIEALIGQKLFYSERPFSSTKRKSEQRLLERASAADSSLEIEAGEDGGPTLKLTNDEAVQMAIRALRQMADTKKHRRTMFEEGILFILTECLKSENPATLKSAIKAYDHYLASDEAKNMISYANRKISHYLATVNVRSSKVTDEYITVMEIADFGCERLVQLCENSDRKMQDSALALVCRLSRQGDFRIRMAKHGVIDLLTKKLGDKTKGTKGWQNLIHSLAFYCREHQHKVTEAEALPVLYSGMVDETLPEELRHFFLNAFVQFSFHPKALAELRKLGLPKNLLTIIEDFTVNNKFEGCFYLKPVEYVDDCDMSDDESAEAEVPISKKEKSFRISSPSYQAIEEEIRQMRKDEGPEVYNLWGFPTSSDMGSVPVSPHSSSEGRCSPMSYPSSPRSPTDYSPSVSPQCSTPPLSPSEELFTSFEYASEPDDENEERCFTPVQEERPKKRFKAEKNKKKVCDIDSLLEQSSALHLSVQESRKRSESENFPLGWSLALLLRFQCIEKKKTVETEEFLTLKTLVDYASSVKEPLRRSGTVIARVAGNPEMFDPICSGKCVPKIANLLTNCKCDRHCLQNTIGSVAFTSLSEVANSGIGVHCLRRLLKANELDVAVSLPFLNLKSSYLLEFFTRTFDVLGDDSQLLSPEALIAIRQYGREFLPQAPPFEKTTSRNPGILKCSVSTCDVTFVTRNGSVAANRKTLSDNNDVFNAMLTRFHSEGTIPFNEACCDTLNILVHFVSGCRKGECEVLRGSGKAVLLGLADAYGVEELAKQTVIEMLSCKFSTENVVEIYKSICTHEFAGVEARRRQVLRKIVNSDSVALVRRILESDARSHFVSTIKDSVLGSLS